MQNAKHNNGVPQRAVKDEVVAKPGYDKPPDLCMARRGIQNSPANFRVLSKKIRRTKDCVAHAFGSIRIIQFRYNKKCNKGIWGNPDPLKTELMQNHFYILSWLYLLLFNLH